MTEFEDICLLERRIHETVMEDVGRNIVPHFIRRERAPPVVGRPTFIDGRGIYEVPLLYDVLGTHYVVERYLVDCDARILYPSPDNEVYKVIFAKLPDLFKGRSN